MAPLTGREYVVVYAARRVYRAYPTRRPPSLHRFFSRKAGIHTGGRRNEQLLGRTCIPEAALRQRAGASHSSGHRHVLQKLLHGPCGTWSSGSAWCLAVPSSADTECLRRGSSLDVTFRSYASPRSTLIEPHSTAARVPFDKAIHIPNP